MKMVHLIYSADRPSAGHMDRITRLALATGAALVFGALLFVLTGDGILYFSSFFSGSPGSSFGSSLVNTGYAIIAVLVVIFIAVVGYLLYRSSSRGNDSWSSW